ncbi:MAG: alpha-L-fucosidase, partial [Candidatus Omnitrophica bacterium]|nr:alpha-L-fucosidase [Candidatus Omnitrophota bacterium]
MSNPFTHSLHLIVILTAFSLPHADLAEAEDYLHAPPEAVKEWRELKFGMFIHWGPVSLMGTEIGWSR